MVMSIGFMLKEIQQKKEKKKKRTLDTVLTRLVDDKLQSKLEITLTMRICEKY